MNELRTAAAKFSQESVPIIPGYKETVNELGKASSAFSCTRRVCEAVSQYIDQQCGVDRDNATIAPAIIVCPLIFSMFDAQGSRAVKLAIAAIQSIIVSHVFDSVSAVQKQDEQAVLALCSRSVQPAQDYVCEVTPSTAAQQLLLAVCAHVQMCDDKVRADVLNTILIGVDSGIIHEKLYSYVIHVLFFCLKDDFQQEIRAAAFNLARYMVLRVLGQAEAQWLEARNSEDPGQIDAIHDLATLERELCSMAAWNGPGDARRSRNQVLSLLMLNVMHKNFSPVLSGAVPLQRCAEEQLIPVLGRYLSLPDLSTAQLFWAMNLLEFLWRTYKGVLAGPLYHLLRDRLLSGLGGREATPAYRHSALCCVARLLGDITPCSPRSISIGSGVDASSIDATAVQTGLRRELVSPGLAKTYNLTPKGTITCGSTLLSLLATYDASGHSFLSDLLPLCCGLLKSQDIAQAPVFTTFDHPPSPSVQPNAGAIRLTRYFPSASVADAACTVTLAVANSIHSIATSGCTLADEVCGRLRAWVSTVRAKELVFERFNQQAQQSPKSAVVALSETLHMNTDPVAVAEFFLEPSHLGYGPCQLSYTAVGAVLGRRFEDHWAHDVLPAYALLAAQRQKWAALGVVGALRAFTSQFVMPPETQEMDRVMLAFCDAYAIATGYGDQLAERDEEDEPVTPNLHDLLHSVQSASASDRAARRAEAAEPLSGPDIYSLSMAVMLVNQQLHSHIAAQSRFSYAEFRDMIQCVDPEGALPDELLERVYRDVEGEALRPPMPMDSVADEEREATAEQTTCATWDASAVTLVEPALAQPMGVVPLRLFGSPLIEALLGAVVGPNPTPGRPSSLDKHAISAVEHFILSSAHTCAIASDEERSDATGVLHTALVALDLMSGLHNYKSASLGTAHSRAIARLLMLPATPVVAVAMSEADWGLYFNARATVNSVMTEALRTRGRRSGQNLSAQTTADNARLVKRALTHVNTQAGISALLLGEETAARVTAAMVGMARSHEDSDSRMFSLSLVSGALEYLVRTRASSPESVPDALLIAFWDKVSCLFTDALGVSEQEVVDSAFANLHRSIDALFQVTEAVEPSALLQPFVALVHDTEDVDTLQRVVSEYGDLCRHHSARFGSGWGTALKILTQAISRVRTMDDSWGSAPPPLAPVAFSVKKAPRSSLAPPVTGGTAAPASLPRITSDSLGVRQSGGSSTPPMQSLLPGLPRPSGLHNMLSSTPSSSMDVANFESHSGSDSDSSSLEAPPVLIQPEPQPVVVPPEEVLLSPEDLLRVIGRSVHMRSASQVFPQRDSASNTAAFISSSGSYSAAPIVGGMARGSGARDLMSLPGQHAQTSALFGPNARALRVHESCVKLLQKIALLGEQLMCTHVESIIACDFQNEALALLGQLRGQSVVDTVSMRAVELLGLFSIHLAGVEGHNVSQLSLLQELLAETTGSRASVRAASLAACAAYLRSLLLGQRLEFGSFKQQGVWLPTGHDILMRATSEPRPLVLTMLQGDSDRVLGQSGAWDSLSRCLLQKVTESGGYPREQNQILDLCAQLVGQGLPLSAAGLPPFLETMEALAVESQATTNASLSVFSGFLSGYGERLPLSEWQGVTSCLRRFSFALLSDSGINDSCSWCAGYDRHGISELLKAANSYSSRFPMGIDVSCVVIVRDIYLSVLSYARKMSQSCAEDPELSIQSCLDFEAAAMSSYLGLISRLLSDELPGRDNCDYSVVIEDENYDTLTVVLDWINDLLRRASGDRCLYFGDSHSECVDRVLSVIKMLRLDYVRPRSRELAKCLVRVIQVLPAQLHFSAASVIDEVIIQFL